VHPEVPENPNPQPPALNPQPPALNPKLPNRYPKQDEAGVVVDHRCAWFLESAVKKSTSASLLDSFTGDPLVLDDVALWGKKAEELQGQLAAKEAELAGQIEEFRQYKIRAHSALRTRGSKDEGVVAQSQRQADKVRTLDPKLRMRGSWPSHRDRPMRCEP
jgi:hypothetical protein